MMTPQTHNRHSRCTFFVLMVLIAALQSYSIFRLERNHVEAVAGREKILAMEMRSEQMLLDHIKRSVDRWQTFQRENPQIKVPNVAEPAQ